MPGSRIKATTLRLRTIGSRAGIGPRQYKAWQERPLSAHVAGNIRRILNADQSAGTEFGDPLRDLRAAFLSSTENDEDRPNKI